MTQPPDMQKTSTWVWRFVAAWSLQGLVAGAALSLGDTGHLPGWILPPVLALAGAVAGGLSMLPLLILRRLRPGAARWLEVTVAGGAGCFAVVFLPLGIARVQAALSGTAAGLIAATIASSAGR